MAPTATPFLPPTQLRCANAITSGSGTPVPTRCVRQFDVVPTSVVVGDHDGLTRQLSTGRVNPRPVAPQRHPRRHPRNRAVRAEQWPAARGVDQRRATAHRRRAIRWPQRPSAGPALRLVGHALVISRAPRRHRAANTPPTRARNAAPSTTHGANLCPRDTRGRQPHRHTAA